MKPDEQTIIHNPKIPQHLTIPPQLLCQESPLLRTKLQHPITIDPVQILLHCARILLQFRSWYDTPDRAPFEIIRFVNVFVRWEQIVHDHEMDLSSPGKLYPMKSIKPAQ